MGEGKRLAPERPGVPKFALDAPQPPHRSPAGSVAGSGRRLIRVSIVKIPRAAVDDADLHAPAPADLTAQALDEPVHADCVGDVRPRRSTGSSGAAADERCATTPA